ncbi:MAG: hypothetical protein JOS17DRAFT_813633 [Linnemannia elongata]|nr:MAG: hypothetical protein JOS17DRAFT_813633 [Linnemannia elongata]
MAQQQERQHSQNQKPGSRLKSSLHQQQQGSFLPGMNKACKSSAASSSSPSRNTETTAQHHHHQNHSLQDQDSTPSSSSSSPDSNFSSAPSAPITLKQTTIENDAGVAVAVTSSAPAPAPGQKVSIDYWTAATSPSFYLAALTATTAVEAARSKIAEMIPWRQQKQAHYRNRQQQPSHTSLFSFTYFLRLLFLVMTTRHTSAIPAPAPAPAPQSPEPSQPVPAGLKAPPPLSPASAPTASSSPPNAGSPDQEAAARPSAPSPTPSPSSSSPQSFPRVPSSVVPVSPPASTSGPSTSSTDTTTTSSTHSSSSTNRPSLTTHRTSQPSGTPYGTIGSSNESSNKIMLTVSLIVVFVILAGMGLVVYCLFRRRSAKRRMHLSGTIGGGKNISGSLDSSAAAAGNSGIGCGGKGKSMTDRRQSNISLGGGSIIGTGDKGDLIVTALAEMQEQQRRISDVDMSRTLQAMTEQHQNELLTRRSSILSLGGLHHHNHHQHHIQQNQQHPGGRVVSPTLGPARPHSALAVGYWGGGSGLVNPTGEGSRRASMSGGSILIGSGNYVAGPLESSPDFRTTVYDGLYYPSRQFLYPSSGAGSSGANSSEQLLQSHHQHHHSYYYGSGLPSSTIMTRRSSLSPGEYPTHPPSEMTGQGQNPSPIFRAKTISTSSGHSYQQQMHYQQHYPPHAGPGPYKPTPPPHSSTPPPHLNRMSVPHPPATIGPNSDDSSETISNNPPSQQQRPEGAGVGVGSSDMIPRTSSPIADPTLEHQQQQQHHPRRLHSLSMLQNNSSFTSPYGATVGPDITRSLSLMSSSTGNFFDQHSQHRASFDGSTQLAIPPSITTRRRSMMPGALGPSGGATTPGGGYPYQQGYPQHQHPYGGSGQDYFLDGQQYQVPPSSASPYSYGNSPYQDNHHPNHYQYAKRSSTQLSREPDRQGKSGHIQDGGAGVGVGAGSSLKTVSSSSSSSSGGTSNTATTAHTPTPTSINLNSVLPKSPPSHQGLPSRSNGNGNGNGKGNSNGASHGPIVHIAPAPPSLSLSSRASATVGLTILPPIESSSAVDLQLTEILNSPTDSSAQ